MFYTASIKPQTDMKIVKDKLGNQAYKKVKSMILKKKLQPGQKIVQDKLAADLGISRTPLSTGLQMLETESLLNHFLDENSRVVI